MRPELFCSVELGLFFLNKFYPEMPVGTLQPLLSGYLQSQSSVQAASRRVRHRMGPASKSGWWRTLLNDYTRVPNVWRCYERCDNPAHRVDDQTVFTAKHSPHCPQRVATYEVALTASLQYIPVPAWKPAPAGGRYAFRRRSAELEFVQMPECLPPVDAVDRLGPPVARVREPWVISRRRDLEPTAEWIDAQLIGRPDIINRNWAKRLAENIRISTVDLSSPTLTEDPDEIGIDGIVNVVGLMNTGKTTFADLIAIDRCRNHGNTVGWVVSSVGDVYNKVSFYRSLGIDAVPLIGRSSRGEHAARYWRAMVEENPDLLGSNGFPPDPAASYTNTSCLLEPFRRRTEGRWTPLEPDEFPCQGELRLVDGAHSSRYDCPLLPLCPAQTALQQIRAAQVWVTTPQCLLASRAEPSAVSVRWLEAMQWHTDLLIIDEADAVQQVFDSAFVQTEHLVGSAEGWTHRMVGHTNDAMAAQDMAPAVDPKVVRWYEQLKTHAERGVQVQSVGLVSTCSAIEGPTARSTLHRPFAVPSSRSGVVRIATHGRGREVVRGSCQQFLPRRAPGVR